MVVRESVGCCWKAKLLWLLEGEGKFWRGKEKVAGLYSDLPGRNAPLDISKLTPFSLYIFR